MDETEIRKDIAKLKEICEQLRDNYDDCEWDLCESDEDELYRITGFEQHDWDENNLAHFIDGMQCALKSMGYTND